MELPHWGGYNTRSTIVSLSLNPYSNGITSLGYYIIRAKGQEGDVLILILMELPHWAYYIIKAKGQEGDVLILILMELPHWEENILITINQLIRPNTQTNYIAFLSKNSSFLRLQN